MPLSERVIVDPRPRQKIELAAPLKPEDAIRLSPLVLENDQVRVVEAGEGLVAGDSSKDCLVSDGFMHCSALILCERMNGDFKMAHVEPIDSLRSTIKGLPLATSTEALFVYGSSSECAFELESMLGLRGVKRRFLRLQTGKETHFSLALNTNTGVVSIARQVPDHSILQYEPFDML